MRVTGRRSPAWFVVLVAAQVVWPLGILVFGDAPSRFGFQMYSAKGGWGYEAKDADGQLVDLPADVLASDRPEIDWREHLPTYLCERFPEVRTVTLTTADGTEDFTC